MYDEVNFSSKSLITEITEQFYLECKDSLFGHRRDFIPIVCYAWLLTQVQKASIFPAEGGRQKMVAVLEPVRGHQLLVPPLWFLIGAQKVVSFLGPTSGQKWFAQDVCGGCVIYVRCGEFLLIARM